MSLYYDRDTMVLARNPEHRFHKWLTEDIFHYFKDFVDWNFLVVTSPGFRPYVMNSDDGFRPVNPIKHLGSWIRSLYSCEILVNGISPEADLHEVVIVSDSEILITRRFFRSLDPMEILIWVSVPLHQQIKTVLDVLQSLIDRESAISREASEFRNLP